MCFTRFCRKYFPKFLGTIEVDTIKVYVIYPNDEPFYIEKFTRQFKQRYLDNDKDAKTVGVLITDLMGTAQDTGSNEIFMIQYQDFYNIKHTTFFLSEHRNKYIEEEIRFPKYDDIVNNSSSSSDTDFENYCEWTITYGIRYRNRSKVRRIRKEHPTKYFGVLHEGLQDSSDSMLECIELLIPDIEELFIQHNPVENPNENSEENIIIFTFS